LQNYYKIIIVISNKSKRILYFENLHEMEYWYSLIVEA